MTLLKLKSEPASRMMDRSPFMFNELFNDFFDNMINNSQRFTSPAVNITETDENFKLSLAAPGLAKEDFKISIDNDMLSISAEKKEEKNTSVEKFTRKEFSFSSFKRTFSLPEQVDAEKVTANYENGVMVLVLPKREEAKPKPTREIKIG
jgi:HSP20 family protein